MMCCRFDARILLAIWPDDADAVMIGEALGVSRHRINDWRRGKGHMIQWWQADTYAIRIGTHPAMVWPDWCEKALATPYQGELW